MKRREYRGALCANSSRVAVLAACAIGAACLCGHRMMTTGRGGAVLRPAERPAHAPDPVPDAGLSSGRGFASSLPRPAEIRDPFADPTLVVISAAPEATSAERVLAEASSSLSVRATMFGAVRCAMINESVYQEGDEVAGFRLVSIERSRVIVEKDGERVAVGLP